MAWKFPKRTLRENSPIDIETINDNFHEFTSEAGNLNEHNWSGNTGPSREAVQIPSRKATTAALKIHSKYWYTWHTIGDDDVDNDYDMVITDADPDLLDTKSHSYIPPYGSGEFTNVLGSPSVGNKPSWQVVESLTGIAQNSSMWIMCSFFHYQNSQPNSLESSSDFGVHPGVGSASHSANGCVQYALRFNGAIIWETATGSAEPDNDPIADRELHGPAALALDAIVPVTDGRFKLELVGRCTSSEDFSTSRAVHGDLMAFEFRR